MREREREERERERRKKERERERRTERERERGIVVSSTPVQASKHFPALKTPSRMAQTALAVAALAVAGLELTREEAEAWVRACGRVGQRPPERCWLQQAGCRSRAGGQPWKLATRWPRLLRPRELGGGVAPGGEWESHTVGFRKPTPPI